MSASLVLDRISKRFGTQEAVADMSLSVSPGELIVLLGPSGCGKTTTLRMIAGFLQPSSGDIRLDGSSLLPLAAHQREMGIVFQSYALFPHLNVARNIGFGLEMRRMGKADIAARVNEMLHMVKLGPFASRFPRQLSGGQQQRVALARALAIQPRLLLLDEPLSNLDAALRLEMAREIRLLQRDRGITTLMVTHDQAEAMALADRLVVMREGRVQQIGRPEDLYERPANPFVAGFIGGSNILNGQLQADRLVLANGTVIALTGHAGAGAATLSVRPETIRLLPAHADGAVKGEVELCTYLGTMVEHLVRVDAETEIIARGPAIGLDAAHRHPPGSRVTVTWTAADEKLFDSEGRPLPALTKNAARQGEKEWTS
jgi:putative spermidine/putrescine transport system ATP-binding protein